MIKRLKALCEAPGIGYGGAAAEAVKAELSKAADEIVTFPLGSVAGIRRCGKKGAPLLLLEAHLDEIGFVVTGIEDGGFVRVSPVGGIDRRVLASQEVVLYGESAIPGVFCTTPPHLKKEGEKLPKAEDFIIDTGLSRDECLSTVPPGTRVGFRPHFERLGEYRVCSKGLDNRAGCEAVLQALEQWQRESSAVDIAALFAVQEEIGGGGAETAAFSLKPDFAVVTDVSFAHTPDAPKEKCGTMGKGTMLGFSPLLDASLTARLRDLAERRHIPFQTEVMGGNTGTDADAVAISRGGVKTALLSIPLRYMHTPNETVDLRDIESTARLMAAVAEEGF